MDPEKNVPENTNSAPISPELTVESLQQLTTPAVSEPVVAQETIPLEPTIPLQTTVETPTSLEPNVAPEQKKEEPLPFDPKLLASKLEDNRTDDETKSELFHQPLQAKTISPEQKKEEPQVIEKIVYEKQRVHGFFRTLTLITLLFVGVLMLLETLHVFSLSISDVSLNTFYPVFIILSVIVIWSYKGIFGKIFGLLMFLSIVAGFFVLGVYSSLTPATTTGTGTIISVNSSGARYSKIYISTLINTLGVHTQSGDALLTSQYNAQRPLSLTSGQVVSGHSYVILSESDQINLLERVYTNLDVGLQQSQPIYLYNKTFFGQSNLDLTTTNVRGLRLHGAVVSRDIILGSPVLANEMPLPDVSVASGTSLSGDSLSGSISTGLTETGINTPLTISHTSLTTGQTIHLDLQAAVANVTLHIPKTMGVRVHYKSFIGKKDFPNFIEKNDTYESQNIETATSILDINAVFGLSKFAIIQDR